MTAIMTKINVIHNAMQVEISRKLFATFIYSCPLIGIVYFMKAMDSVSMVGVNLPGIIQCPLCQDKDY